MKKVGLNTAPPLRIYYIRRMRHGALHQNACHQASLRIHRANLGNSKHTIPCPATNHENNMQRRLLIDHVIMVNEGREFKGALLIENEHIGRIVEGEVDYSSIATDAIIDAEGCYLIPGVMDEHVHFRDPGLTYKADMESESRAAAAGGVTTVFDMPNTKPQTTTTEALREKFSIAAKKCCINYGFFLGATTDNTDALLHLNPRKVAGVKLFMGASTGNMLVDDDKALRKIFQVSKMPVMVHCEDSQIINDNMKACKEKNGEDPDIKFHPLIRSEEACVASTTKAVELAKEYGTRLHVAHISTERELALFSPEHPNITAEICVPHLLFCDEDYARLGARIKCNPAVKTKADREALRKALNDGTAATIATDHAPHAIYEKIGGAAKALSGMPMVQFSLVSMLELVDKGILPMTRLVELMCHAPARLFNVELRGFLREGYKADLVLLRPHAPWTLTPNRIESKCNWSPMEGHVFNWRVEKTYCNGFLLYNQGRITNEAFRGQPVTFDR